MISKKINYMFNEVYLSCDAKCEKAWGINNRPETSEGKYKKDSELGIALAAPGTYEGTCSKPTNQKELLNKWCARECERSLLVEDFNDINEKVKLHLSQLI